MMTPPWLDDEASLVLVDWSWWLNKSFALFGLEGMTSSVVGTLCALLSYRPAQLAIVLDAPGETHRHRMRHPTDEQWRYKGKRDPKPREFYELSDRLTDIAEMHAIPVLWCAEREADDVIATVTGKARAAGYRVWICSSDKDLCGLVEADAKSGILTGTWDNYTGAWRGPEEVRAHFGVEPSQIADYLAIAGDGVDAVPGVHGLGKEKAAALLNFFDTLDAALTAPPWPAEQHDTVARNVAAMAKRLKITSDPETRAAIEKARAEQMAARQLAKWHAILREHEAIARFSRDLTALDCGAPIGIPWEQLPCGGFDTEALRKRFHAMGFTEKARQVPSYPKRAPWVIPYEDDAA